MEICTLSSLKKIYHDSKEHIFLLAALSPTGVPCLEGAQLVQEIFEENKSEILYGAIIWTPMIDTDSLEAANLRELGFAASRVKQFGDPYRILGRLLSQTLRLRISIAWDVYLIYLLDHPWDGELPPEPEFWMHQQDEEMSLYLDPPRLKHYVQTVLGRIAFQGLIHAVAHPKPEMLFAIYPLRIFSALFEIGTAVPNAARPARRLKDRL